MQSGPSKMLGYSIAVVVHLLKPDILLFIFFCSFCFKFRKTTANHSNPDYNYRKYNSNHFFHCKPKTGNKNFYKKYFVSQLKHIISVNFIIQL